MSESVTCIHCGEPVTTITRPFYGTYWIHCDGYEECRPTYASPRFSKAHH